MSAPTDHRAVEGNHSDRVDDSTDVRGAVSALNLATDDANRRTIR
ncbi:MAG TPA: hypothetical protein VMM56_03340 [Planctomycetaceae bacterium]|nr:hypothetical protein [Planctomycetaceae bacterium]